MEHDRSLSRQLSGTGPRLGESDAAYHERLAQERASAQERWEQALRDQSAPENDAAARIRIWERRHQVDLPRDPGHRLIAVIATSTDLTVREVLAEQSARAAAKLPAAAKSQDQTDGRLPTID
jgi:hypothetical protein